MNDLVVINDVEIEGLYNASLNFVRRNDAFALINGERYRITDISIAEWSNFYTLGRYAANYHTITTRISDITYIFGNYEKTYIDKFRKRYMIQLEIPNKMLIDITLEN